MQRRDPRRESFEIVLRYRMEEILAEVDTLEEKLSRTPDSDIDQLPKARAMAALEGVRRHLIEWLLGETDPLTPVV